MKRIVIALMSIMALSACGAEAEQDSTPTAPAQSELGSDGVVKINLDTAYRDVYEFTLSDGTMCVAAANSDGANYIVCNWTDEKEPVEEVFE